MSVLICLPSKDFDPSEAGVTWAVLNRAGVAVNFATPQGRKPEPDQVMLTGAGLGPLKYSLCANPDGRAACAAMLESKAAGAPRPYTELREQDYRALVLPGGHAPGMREYLEAPELQRLVSEFFAKGKPVAAICHGVVLLARSRAGERSVLHGRKTTALPAWMENFAWNLTRAWLGNYYRTYPQSVQAEVTATLRAPEDFLRGPLGTARDSESRLDRGFIVRDGNYLSARWPGDAHRFGHELLKML